MTASIELGQDVERAIVSAAIENISKLMLADVILTREETAAYLRITPKTLNLLPIPRVKVGGSTRYRRQDILTYIEKNVER